MKADKWKEVSEIFHQALDLTPEERLKYLQRVCAGNDSLRVIVESLLKANEESDSFFDWPAAARISLSSPELKPREMVAHYEIRSLLGEGGMGRVYLAEDTKLRREVALKVLSAELSSSDRRRRFLREARAAAALDHPSICAIYEVGEAAENSYIAMQYLSGETLAARIASHEISLREALTFSIQIADALTTAHARNIIHRDIKPSNLILTPRGDVKVVDFGLAKVTSKPVEALSIAETTLLTQPGLIVGTVPYMSPEQARGQDVDGRTDIWSLGVILYEMIAHRRPFAGQSNTDTLAAILHKEPEPLGQFAEQLPSELERIVGKMLRKDRDERYQTAKDVLTDLKAVDKQLSTDTSSQANRSALTAERPDLKVAKPASEVPRPSLSPGSLSKGRLLLSAIGLLLIAAAFVTFWKLFKTQPESDKPRLRGIAQVTTWPGLDIHPSLSPDGNAIAYSSDHDGSFEIYVTSLTPGSRETQITSDRQQNFEPAWSPDGQRIAYSSKNRGGIWIVPASGGNARQISQFGSHPSWSPDGTMLAFQSDPITNLGAQAAPSQPPSLIWLVPANGNSEPRKLTQLGQPAGGHGAPAWSPDGKHIAFCVSDFGFHSIWITPVVGDEPKKALANGLDPLYGPQGNSLYYVTASGLWQTQISSDTNLPTGEPLQLSSSFSERIRYFSISADGRRIVYSALLTDSNVWTLPLDSSTGLPNGASRELTRDRSLRNSLPWFSPDGKRIAFNTQRINRDRRDGDIWVIDEDGNNKRQITTEGGGLATWFPNGQQLAFLSSRDLRRVWIADLQTGQDKPSLDFAEEISYMRLSPNGEQIAYNSIRNGTTNIWKIPSSGGVPTQLTFDTEFMGYPCWSPDGKLLAFQTKRADDANIVVMSSDGGPVTPLTFEKGQNWPHSFSPDGDRVAFAGFRDGVWNLWWVSSSTKEQKRLTNYSKMNAFVRYPAWSPLGNQIAYEYAETTGNIWRAEIH
jgi:eukaryotic-like serine/threonine-protein kinase